MLSSYKNSILDVRFSRGRYTRELQHFRTKLGIRLLCLLGFVIYIEVYRKFQFLALKQRHDTNELPRSARNDKHIHPRGNRFHKIENEINEFI